MTPPSSSRHDLWGVAAAAVVLVVYLLVLYVMPKHAFWSPDEGGRFFELMSMRWENGLSYELPYPGQHLDPDFRFFPGHGVYPTHQNDGSIRFPWPIWFPLLSRAPFALFGITGIYLVPLVAGWLIAVVCGILCRKLGSPLVGPTILLVGLASPVFFYSLTFWEHTLTTLLALLAVLVVVHGNGRATSLLAAAPLVVMAIMLRIEMLAFAVALPLAVWICNFRVPVADIATGDSRSSRFRQRTLLFAGLAAVVVLAVLWLSALPARHRGFLTSGPFWQEEGSRWLWAPKGLIELVINSSRSEGPSAYMRWAAIAFGAGVVVVLAAFVRSVRLEAVLVLPGLLVFSTFSVLLALLPQPYRAVHGIIPVAPYMIVAWYVLPEAWRRRQRLLLFVSTLATLYFLGGIAAILTFYMGRTGLNTTLEWGQRYLLTLYPLWALLSVISIHEYWRSVRPRRLRLAFALLVVSLIHVGMQQQIRGLRMLYDNRERLARWDTLLRGHDIVVTDIWWLPSAVAPLFSTHEIFVLWARDDLLGWVEQVRPLGVRRFTFATDEAANRAGPWPQGVRSLDWKSYTEGLYLGEFEIVDDDGDAIP